LRVTRRAIAHALFATVLVAPILGACGESGFRPLYGSAGVGAQVDDKFAKVQFSAIPGRVGQMIRNELIFQSTGGGHPVPPEYRLDVAIRETVTSTLVQTDGNSLGQIYSVDASFQLIRLSDNSVALKGISYGRAGFERFDSIFSNVRAQQDAENRAARTVGEELRTRLTAFLASQA
jgi:LPS-assembly lipoprotein